MKTIFLIFNFVVICISANAVDMDKCPLNHKNFKIIDYPRSSWFRGWMYHYQVMTYLFKSEAERKLAILRLSKAGYGEGKMNYIYINGRNISVNGEIFSSLAKAKEYIKNKKIKKILYVSEGIPREKILKNFKIPGVKVWQKDWEKTPDNV